MGPEQDTRERKHELPSAAKAVGVLALAGVAAMTIGVPLAVGAAITTAVLLAPEPEPEPVGPVESEPEPEPEPPPPTQMMLCKPDGSDKHDRWFWVDADNHTLSWGKKPRVAAKGPFVLTGVEEYAGGRLKFVTDGEAAVVKPADDAVYQLWLRGCRAVLKTLPGIEALEEPGDTEGQTKTVWVLDDSGVF